MICSCFFLFSSFKSDASIIQLGYSGTIESSYDHFEPGTVIFVWFSFDSDSAYDLIDNKLLFPAYDINLSINGQSATNEFGYLRVFADRLEFRAGSGIADGGGSPFSDVFDGEEVRGISMTLWGDFIVDQLPSDTSQLYGGSGEFSIYRTYGTLYDVNHPDLLQLPSNNPVTIPSPSTLLLLLPAFWVLRQRHG